MNIIFATLDKIGCWLRKYLSRAWLLYDILFYDNLFVKAVLFLLLCLDVWAKSIDCEPSLKVDALEIMSCLILMVCGAAYIIPICLPN